MLVNKMSKILSLLFLFCIIKVSATQLNGSYSINPSATATATNFQNFASAISYLTSASARTDGGPSNSIPFGVSGPVVFNISAGTYTGQISIITISGASSINTITFDGGIGNASTRIITYSGTFSSFPTIDINNSPYLIIRNLTIIGTSSSYAFGVSIRGTSNNCRISNCIINVPSSTVSSINGIIIGGNINGTNPATRIDSVLIDSNIITGGYYGIFFNGINASNHSLQNSIIKNQVSNFANKGVALLGQNGISVSNNTINKGGTGLYIQSSNNNASIPILISGNRITNCITNLYVLSCTNTISNVGFITNNFLGGGTKSATAFSCQIESSSYWNIANNSINYDTISSFNTNSSLYLNTSTDISIINNILAIKKTNNPALPLYINSGSTIDIMDYNVFYREDTTDHSLINYLGVNYNSGNFKGVGGFNLHSLYINPGFVNDTNLHISIPCLTGTALSYVNTDIDGNIRNSPPNIGAYEVQRYSNDVSPTLILQPNYPISVGLQNLGVRLINYGTNAIFSFNLSYKLNGNSPITQSWSGILNPCDTVSILFTGAQQINVPSGANTLKIYSSSPNFTADGNTLNDTLVSSFVTAMSGTYTIGPPPSNYTTFGAAISDLSVLGVGGAVKFMIKTGTYNESLSITTPTGASISNSIGFYSVTGIADSVIVNANGVYVMNISGSFFSFNKITFNQLSSTTAGVVSYNGFPSFDTIYGCKLIAPTTSNSASNVVYGNNVILSSIVMRRNIIQGGYNNLNIVSNSTTYSNNCVIDSLSLIHI